MFFIKKKTKQWFKCEMYVKDMEPMPRSCKCAHAQYNLMGPLKVDIPEKSASILLCFVNRVTIFWNLVAP